MILDLLSLSPLLPNLPSSLSSSPSSTHLLLIPDSTMSENQELAVAYAALILHDADLAITADKLKSLLTYAGVEVESYWPMLFARALKGRDVASLVLSCGGGSGGAPSGSTGGAAAPAAGGAAAKVEEKEEEKEEEEVDAGVGGECGG